MSTYRISQLAKRSGVPATTLRFYETAGLLPADRTPTGYRVYGDDAVQRLAFISSAKLLGLPLEDIRDLLGVWERGVCAHVRARLLPLVTDRIADADRRIAELQAFTAHLTGVHQELTGPAPEGACGPGCGCVSTTPAGPVPVELSLTRPDRSGSGGGRGEAGDLDESWRQAPVACSLAGADQEGRARQWQQLLASSTGREDTGDGLRVTFPAGPEVAADVARLAAAEQDCCAFFDFTLHLTPTALVLTVRAPEAADALVAELFGALT
ncbi:heavy metal-responsive transcriptional regulator [Streptomyces lunaelactis]|uniref:Heavy metal-responsive transcriptional regulator n=1 Tax=Streptomyces lunaelactis TaxID=1535768 RepID=A0A2R4T170_9ACTN|nr:heavy metal-responsive transcriptional regulator [Streptomyces lunaelactis]AVZ72885.1 heavy metal-responsive transcriptional regulator [Streptomyces lunaelactis]NUK86610.1 heavy metal-responsive transcriptional regulator [Streptomyces lunaelactis]